MAKPKSRYKTIRQDFIEDDRCATVSLPALLMWNFMKVFCDDKGFIAANDKLIRSKCFPQRDDVTVDVFTSLITDLEANKLLVTFVHSDGKKYYALDFTHEKLDREKESELGPDAPIFFPMTNNARCVAPSRDESGQSGEEKEGSEEKEHETEREGESGGAGDEKSPQQPEKRIGDLAEKADSASLNPGATQQHPPGSAAPPLGNVPNEPEVVSEIPKAGNAVIAWRHCQPAFSTELFQRWLKLCVMKKWLRKEPAAVVGALEQLMKYPEGFARELIDAAIGGGWQGVVFADTPVKFDKWKKSKQSKTTGNGANNTPGLAGAIVSERAAYGKY